MSSWRQVFGYLPEDQPAYEAVYARWQELVRPYERNQMRVDEFKLALGEARHELLERQRDTDTVNSEQLLPP